MKILKNKLFIWGILAIIFLLSFQIYHAHSQNIRDTSSYVSVVRGEVFHNSIALIENERKKLSAGDIVRTWLESIAVIEWWDGSITRLWELSEIQLTRDIVSEDKSYINISFELFSGKSWSQVVSFLGNDSSFTQEFEGLEAWVRGTVFDIDLESWFIRTSEHAVEILGPDNLRVVITPEKPFDIVKQVFIDMDVFLRAFTDTSWTDFNILSDREYRQKLIQELEKNSRAFNPFLKIMEWLSPKYRILYELDTTSDFQTVEAQIQKINTRQRQWVFDAVLERYQDYIIVWGYEQELYSRKLMYQQALVRLSDDRSFQASILERTILDIDSLIESWKREQLDRVLGFVNSYSELIPEIDTTVLERGLELIPEELRSEFQKSFEMIEDIFWIRINTIWNLQPQNILNNTSGAIENFLEETLGDSIRNWLR